MPQVPYNPAPTRENTGVGGTQFNLNVNADMFGGGVGRALQGFGAQVEKLGDVFAQQALTKSNFDQEADLTDLKTYADKGIIDAGNNMTGDGTSFAKDYFQGFHKIADGLMKKYPNARGLDIKIKEIERQQFGKVYATQQTKMNEYYKGQVDEKLGVALSDIQNNPTEAGVKQWQSRIDAMITASGMTDQAKEAYRKHAKDMAEKYYAYGAAQKDPARVAGALGGPTGYLDKVGGMESSNQSIGFHDQRKSSAYGRFGFVEETWKNVANSAAGKAAGLSPSFPPKDTAQEAIGARILTEQNSAALSKAGITPNEKNLYLAHFLGAGGATQLIQAMQRDPNQSAAALLPDAARANGSVFYAKSGGEERTRPRTVAEVYALQTRKFAGETPAMLGSDPILNALAPDDKNKILGVAQRQLAQQSAAAQAAENAQYADYINNIGLSVRQGMFGPADLNAAIAAGKVTDMADITKVEGWIKKYNEDIGDKALVNQRIAAGEPLTPTDKHNKNGVEQISDGFNTLPKDDRIRANGNLARQTGILPDSLRAEITAGMNSTNPQQMFFAAALAARLQADTPRIFDSVEGGSNIRDFVAEYSAYKQAGVPDAEAGQFMVRKNEAGWRPVKLDTPAYEKVRDTANKAPAAFGEMKLKEADAIDRSFWNKSKVEPGVAASAAEDYMGFYKLMYERSGNEQISDNYAKARLKQMYGDFNGQAMKYPPNKTYPPDLNGKSEYLAADITATAQRYTGRPVTGFQVRPLETTYADAAAGRPPQYEILAIYKDASGLEQRDVVPSPWLMPPGAIARHNQSIYDARKRKEQGIVLPEDVDPNLPGAQTPEGRAKIAEEATKFKQGQMERRFKNTEDFENTLNRTAEKLRATGAGQKNAIERMNQGIQ